MDLAGSLNKAIEIVKLNGTVAAEVGGTRSRCSPAWLRRRERSGAGSPRSSSTAASAADFEPIRAIIGYFVGSGSCTSWRRRLRRRATS
jgi:hypothetical protein